MDDLEDDDIYPPFFERGVGRLQANRFEAWQGRRINRKRFAMPLQKMTLMVKIITVGIRRKTIMVKKMVEEKEEDDKDVRFMDKLVKPGLLVLKA